MKNLNRIIFLCLFSLSLPIIANAGGYTENLYLCDLGIMNGNRSNQLGVDFIQYIQGGKTLSVNSTSYFSTALNIATNINLSFDRWNASNGITDVSINLESDFYGSRYYLEYCYTWDRTLPSDNLNYDVNFITTLPNAIPFTQLGVDTNCSLKANNGAVMNTSILQSTNALNTISTDFTSMRCTIRLNFNENSYITSRPHNGDTIGVDPRITVKVTP